MKSWEWLKATGLRYLRMMDAEDVVFLNQIELPVAEQALLVSQLSRGRPLPWADWANACVAVAVVQVARDASSDERSLPHLFLSKLGLAYDQQSWEEEFGRRVEDVMRRFFPDDYVGRGAGRYVGPVYRHAGIPALATQRFGGFVRKLLDRYGASFTRQEYDILRQGVGGVASSFLASEHGYVYTKNAARILNDIDLNRIRAFEIDQVPGFRRGFWTEILAGAGRRVDGTALRAERVQYSDPFLALSLEELDLEIRFDWRGVQRGLYSLNGTCLTKASERCSCEAQPWIEVAGKRFLLERWWSPGLTKAALFRASDGGFVTGRGGVPPGRYYLVAQAEDALSPEWIEAESGYLGATGWRIWHVALPARCEIPALDIYATGKVPAPEIEFDGKKRHLLGANVFESALPQLLIRHWDDANVARFWIVVETDSGSCPLDVPVGRRLVPVLVACPSAGLIKVQPRGLVRQESALSVLPFTVVPPGFKVCFSKQLYVGNEPACAECSVPEGWRVLWRGEERYSRWEIPAQETTLDAAATNGVVRIEISLRIPRISVLVVGGEGGTCWGSTEVRYVCVQGPSGFKFELVLAADGVPVALTSIETIPRNGIIRLEGGHFKDALRSCGLAAGEFALRLTDGTLVRSGYHYASAEGIRDEMGATFFPAAISELPGVGTLLASVQRMFSEAITSFDWNQAAQCERLKNWLATMAYCAHIFDRTKVEGDPAGYADPAIVCVCAWYLRASGHGQIGEASKRVLDELPAGWEQLPVERWRGAVRKAIEGLALQADVPKLVEEWRKGIVRRDGSALETEIGRRAGGEKLCEGARQYLIANEKEMGGKARNKSFNAAIAELEGCRSMTDCLLIRAIAATLLRLAYEKSRRTNELSDELREESLWAELDQIEVSPW